MLHNKIKNIILICLFSLAVIWGALYYHTSTDRSLIIAAAEVSSANLALAFEEHVKKTVQIIDGLLLQLRGEYQRNPLAFGDRIRFIAEHKSVADLLIQVSVTDKQGIMTFNTKGLPSVPLDLSDREHFRTHLTGPDDQLFISKPVLGRVSQKWSIQFTRKIVDKGGAFAGVIVLSIDPDYFSNFYKGIDIGPGGAVTLVGMDGVIRARASKSPTAKEARGVVVPKDRSFLDPTKPVAGIFKVPSVMDGVVRIGAYRRLQNYPLVVVVLQAEKDILSVSNKGAIPEIFAGVILSGLVLLFGGVYLTNERRRSALLKALQEGKEELRKQNETLKTTEDILSEQNDHLMATEEMLRVQVSEYESTQKLLKESEEKLRKLTNEQQIILNSTSVGIIFVKNRKVLWANPAHCKLFGYEVAETHQMETAEHYVDKESYIYMSEKKGIPQLHPAASSQKIL